MRASTHALPRTTHRTTRRTPQLARVVAASLLLAACSSGALAEVRVMDFDTDAWGDPILPGSTFSMQYAAWGVGVSANPFTGFSPAGTNDLWATNTDLTIGTDVGVTARTTGGNSLHSLTGWLAEDGDPSFELTFLYRIDSISAVFTAIATNDAFAGIIAYNDLDEVIADVRVADPLQGASFTQTLTLTNLGAASRVVIIPGTFDDWVGVDDIAFGDAVIPAPSAAALLTLAALGAPRRSRRA